MTMRNFQQLIWQFSSLTFLLLVGYLTLAPVYAKPGNFDRSYGNNGILKTSFPQASEILASTFQSDGKYVVVGSIGQPTTNTDFYVVRIDADGTLDSTFGGNGRVIIPVTVREDRASNVAVQQDGKIVICGSTRDANAHWDFAVVRLNPDGSLDTTFDGDGIQITSISPNDDYAQAVTVQEDGKIVVAGKGFTTRQNFEVVRYNLDGSLDITFDGDGVTTTQFPDGASEANAITIQSDGKIVVGGDIGIGGQFINAVFGIARYYSNGSLDTAFGNSGTVFADVRTGPAQANSVRSILIQPDNKIVAVGESNSGLSTFYDFAALRLNSDGSPDNSFGNGGKVVTPIGANGDYAKSVVQQSDGKLLVGGMGQIAFSTGFTLARFNSDGTLDSRFGNNGIAFVLPQTGAGISSLLIRPDGQIKAGGYSLSDITLVKFFANGSIASDFDGDGKTDLSIFRPNGATGSEWWYLKSSNGGNYATQFGTPTDKLVAADYTGDGKADIAFFRPSTGFWYILRSEDSSFYAFPFGAAGDIPAPADYDGDGKADAAVFRPSSATWFIQNSGGGTTIQAFGTAGDVPVAADYDGDGKADLAIYRPNGTNGSEWWILRSTAGLIATQFGAPTDKTVVGDYTGDGKADVAFWRPSTGQWYILRSEDFSFYAFPFGANGDIPVPGDYDADGKTDAAVFRPTGSTWFAQGSTSGTIIQQFGTTGDVPVPSEFVR